MVLDAAIFYLVILFIGCMSCPSLQAGSGWGTAKLIKTTETTTSRDYNLETENGFQAGDHQRMFL